MGYFWPSSLTKKWHILALLTGTNDYRIGYVLANGEPGGPAVIDGGHLVGEVALASPNKANPTLEFDHSYGKRN